MAKMGRPKVIMDNDPKAKATFEIMMGIPFVEKAHMCSMFNCSRATLDRWIKKNYSATFEDLKTQKRADMNLKLAATQYETAVIKKNVPMQIWLGKQWLGQSDKNEVKSESKPIQINIDKQDENL